MTSERRVNLTEAGQMLGVHRNTVRNWVIAGRFETARKVPRGGLTEWTIDEAEVLKVRRQSGPGRSGSAASVSEAVWIIHDLANRLADAEARAARAETKLDMLKRHQHPRSP